MAWMMDTYSVQKGYAVPGDRDRQAGLDRRLGLPQRGDRRRRRDGDRARLRAARLDARRADAASSRASATSAASPRPSSTRRARRWWRSSDVAGGVVRDPPASTSRRSHECAREHGSLEGFPGASAISHEELLEIECDVLVLAAREDQVTGANARQPPLPAGRRGRERADLGRRRTRSSPTAASRCCPTCSRTPAGSPSRTSSGCRTSSRLFWDRDEIRRRLAEKLGDAFDRVWTLSEADGVSLRERGADRRHPRRRRRARGAGDLPVSAVSGEQRVRDAMVADPHTLEAAATAQEAGEALMRPEVRAVLVSSGGRARRRHHAQDARARGRRARARPAHDDRSARSPSRRTRRSSRDTPARGGVPFLEEHDHERVPVVDGRQAGRGSCRARPSGGD